jgi:Skp family chaperone for outer membrane proteins
MKQNTLKTLFILSALLSLTLMISLPSMVIAELNAGNWNDRSQDRRGNMQDRMNDMQNRRQDRRENMQDRWDNMRGRQDDRRDHMRDQWDDRGSHSRGHDRGNNHGGRNH